MRVLISGGSGLIGRRLTSYLLAQNHHPLILSRNPQRQTDLPPGAELVAWDAKTANGWGHLVNDIDAVVNLAGAGIADVPWTPARKKLIIESRVGAAEAMLAALQQAERKPPVLVQASAVGYYGDRGDERITETSDPGSGFLTEVCQAWEAAIGPASEMGMRVPILRTGVVLTPEGGALGRMLPVFQLFAGGPLAGGRQWFPWIHPDDLVRAIYFLMNHSQAAGPFNLSSPNPVTNAEFTRALGRQLNRPTVMPVPALALRTLFGQMADVLLTGQRVYPTRLQEYGFEFHFTAVEAALHDLLK